MTRKSATIPALRRRLNDCNPKGLGKEYMERFDQLQPTDLLTITSSMAHYERRHDRQQVNGLAHQNRPTYSFPVPNVLSWRYHMRSLAIAYLATVSTVVSSLMADVAVVSDCYCASLGLEAVQDQSAIDSLTPWQLLHYHLQKHGDKVVLNNLSDREVETLRSPSTTAVIFNNHPVWCGRDLSQLLPSIHAKKILVCWEPPTVLPQMFDESVWTLYDIVLIWDVNRQDNSHVFHFCYPNLLPFRTPLKPFAERRLLTQISRNKYFRGPYELYTLRKSVNDYFEAHPDLDFTFYGQWWGNAGYRKYGGAIRDKIDTMQHFKFAICFENTKNVKGYITEKIFDCFAAGCVPIYYGAPDIADYIPRNCYIAWEDFGSIEKAYEHVKNMKEEEYSRYIENIQAFLSSDAGKRFTTPYFIQNILKVLGKDM
jgi:hypothetical protein